MLTKCNILLGSNLGNCLQNLKLAVELIQLRIGKINKASSIYKTAAWGNTEQGDFYNQVLLVETLLNPHELLTGLLSIEKNMGRERKYKWEPRIIDLDILYFGDQVVNDENLIIPHPWLHKRRFTLAPLVEISPDFVHPILVQSNQQLLEICEDLLSVEKL